MGDRVPDLLRSADPAHAALVTAETGHTLGYGALADTVGSLAGRLAALGIERGSRVAIVLPDGPELLRVLFAVVALGATAAPLNPAYQTPRVRVLPRRPAAGAAARVGGVGRDGPRSGGYACARGRGDVGPRRAHPARRWSCRRARGALRGGRRRGRRAAAPHERDDEPTQAGAAAPPEPRSVGARDRVLLLARRGGRLLRRD